MFNVKTLFIRGLLACALASGAGAALAVPTSYHVDIDSTSASGAALLNFDFGAYGNAEPAHAVLTNFAGNFGSVYESVGAVSGSVATGLDLANTSVENYLSQFVTLGGKFSFDVMFDVTASNPGSELSVWLYQLDYADLALGTGSLVSFSLTPFDGIAVSADGAFASVVAIAEVPEPGQWLLMATGLLLLGATVRRRSL